MASIRERNGSYQITVSCGYDINGKKLTETTTFTPDPSLSPKKREKAVQEFALQFESNIRNGAIMEGRKTSLKEFSDRWLREYAQQKLQPGTLVKYTHELYEKILPALGHLKLTALKPHTLNAFFLSLTRDGARKDGKPGGYSKGSIVKTRNVLSSVLRTAVEWEVIERNPCEKVRLQMEDASDKVKFFTPEQTILFLNYIEQPYTFTISGHKRVDDTGKPYTAGDYQITREIPEQIRVMFNLAVYGGLRKGEVLALQWSDIDFQNNTIRVSKAVTRVNGEQLCKAPKTKKSNRVIAIPHFLTTRLHNLRHDQLLYKQQVGSYWQGDDWVFIQDNGKMMNYSTPYQALQDALRRYNASAPEGAKLPLISFHGLRHTSATLLIATKQDIKTVSNRLGHAQTSTTMNIYAHALRENDHRAADALENLLENQS